MAVLKVIAEENLILGVSGLKKVPVKHILKNALLLQNALNAKKNALLLQKACITNAFLFNDILTILPLWPNPTGLCIFGKGILATQCALWK